MWYIEQMFKEFLSCVWECLVGGLEGEVIMFVVEVLSQTNR